MDRKQLKQLEEINGLAKIIKILENNRKSEENVETSIRFRADSGASQMEVEMKGMAGMMMFGLGKMAVELAARCDAPIDTVIEDLTEIIRGIECERLHEGLEELTIKFNEEERTDG